MSISSRKLNIVRGIACQGLIDSKGIHSLVGPHLSRKTSEKETTSLMAMGLIWSQRIIGSKKIYSLTPLGARSIDVPDRRAGEPFAGQGLMMNYLIMSYCLHGEKKFRRLTRPDFVQGFPELVAPRVLSSSFRTRYYADDTDDEIRLGLLLCDFGANIRRLHKKIRREAQKRYEANEAWNDALRTHTFSFTVLTFLESKARRIRALLEDEAFHTRVCCVEDAADLFQRGKS